MHPVIHSARTFSIPLVAAAILAIGIHAQPAEGAVTFADPIAWQVGDANSTHQAWEQLASNIGNTPDVSYVASAIDASSTLSVASPGFASLTSGNFYSFTADYAIEADIFNHGGEFGRGADPLLGTHVIVQIVSTLNEGVGVYADTLRLLDATGTVLPGGGYSEALRSTVVSVDEVPDPFGDTVVVEHRIWEFFLPAYNNDFTIAADVRVHSSFTAMQVDTMLSESALPIVPEPASALLLAAGSVMLLRRHNR